MRVRSETNKLQEMFLTDAHFKTRLQNSDEDLFTALSTENHRQVEKIVSDRLKEVMNK